MNRAWGVDERGGGVKQGIFLGEGVVGCLN